MMTMTMTTMTIFCLKVEVEEGFPWKLATFDLFCIHHNVVVPFIIKLDQEEDEDGFE